MDLPEKRGKLRDSRHDEELHTALYSAWDHVVENLDDTAIDLEGSELRDYVFVI